MKVLVTCFEPFGGQSINPSQDAVKKLPERIDGMEIARVSLPVVFRRAGDEALDAISRVAPDAVVCVGQAGGRAKMTIERVAINIDDARMPDNAGCCPEDTPIVPDGPAAYFATLPLKAMVSAMNASGVPAEISNSAGTYVCNHLMYRVLHAVSGTRVRAGFIHVPFVPEQAVNGAPSLPLDDIVRGLRTAIACLSRKG